MLFLGSQLRNLNTKVTGKYNMVWVAYTSFYDYKKPPGMYKWIFLHIFYKKTNLK